MKEIKNQISKIKILEFLIFYFLFFIFDIFFISAPVFPSQLLNWSIGKKIDSIIQNRCLSDAKVGIKIMSLKTGETVYERNSDELLIPASNVKLITSAAALTRLKPNYKFRTTVAYDGAIDGNILNGNLYIKGYGDPKLVT
ncbi:MAG TPA: hypothetical protein DCY98_01850, partial [Nitrospinae bacterium]|nr:hypothetical protein [Nitrospinota bacterium]